MNWYTLYYACVDSLILQAYIVCPPFPTRVGHAVFFSHFFKNWANFLNKQLCNQKQNNHFWWFSHTHIHTSWTPAWNAIGHCFSVPLICPHFDWTIVLKVKMMFQSVLKQWHKWSDYYSQKHLQSTDAPWWMQPKTSAQPNENCSNYDLSFLSKSSLTWLIL